jgi:hypothetical protein
MRSLSMSSASTLDVQYLKVGVARSIISGAMTLFIMTLSITTFSLKGLFVTLSITQLILLSVTNKPLMLSVIMLNAVMLNVVVPF